MERTRLTSTSTALSQTNDGTADMTSTPVMDLNLPTVPRPPSRDTASYRMPMIYPPVLMSKFEPRRESYLPKKKSKLAISTSYDDEVESEETVADAISTSPISSTSTLVAETSYDELELGDTRTSLGASSDAESTSQAHSSSSSAAATPALETNKTANLDISLGIPFNIYDTMPLTHKSNKWALAVPSDPEEWCIAVIHQRWYQSLGYKWKASPTEFMHHARQGIVQLQKLHEAGLKDCVLQPVKYILHDWASDIMDEIQAEIESPQERALTHHGDGSWAFPDVIVPSIIECLPLEYEDRVYYHARVSHLWKFLEQPRHHLNPRQRKGEMEKSLKNHFLDNMEAEINLISLKIGLKMKVFLRETHSSLELKEMMQEWDDEVRKEQEELDAATKAVEDAMQVIVERERAMGVGVEWPGEASADQELAHYADDDDDDVPDIPGFFDSDSDDSDSSDDEWL